MGVFILKKVYIVLTYTGTILSQIVRLYTKKDYSHVSLSLDKDLNQMYSFGRLFSYTPIFAGFVQESPKYGTFKRFKKTRSKIYSLEISDKDYKTVQETIEKFKKNRRKYGFNMLGLIAVMGHYHIKRRKHLYCAEFVKIVLEQTSLDLHLPEVIKPDDFQRIEGAKEVYTGLLRDYNSLS